MTDWSEGYWDSYETNYVGSMGEEDVYDWPDEWWNDPDYYDVWIKNDDQSVNSWVLIVQFDDGAVEDINAELDESAEQHIEITPEDLNTAQAAE